MRIMFLCLLVISGSFVTISTVAFSADELKTRSVDKKKGGDASQEWRRERAQQEFLRVIDDIRFSKSLAEEEINELSDSIKRITLLESPRKEDDFQDILNWYHDYLDKLSGFESELDGRLARIYGNQTLTGADAQIDYAEIISMYGDSVKVMKDKVKGYEKERKRLADIIDRRRILNSRISDLQDQVAAIERRLAELQPGAAGRAERERKAVKLHLEMQTARSEFVIMPSIPVDLLDHYSVLTERGGGEVVRLEAKAREYKGLKDVAGVMGREKRSDAQAIEAAYLRVEGLYEREIDRLKRKSDEIYRKRQRLSPGGTIRKLDSTHELGNYYERLMDRLERQTNRLKILVGALEADKSGIISRLAQ